MKGLIGFKNRKLELIRHTAHDLKMLRVMGDWAVPLFDWLDFQIWVQFSSVSQAWLTFCDPMNHSTLGLPVHHQLPEFTQTHVHRVGDGIWNKLKLTHRRVCLNSLQIYNFTLAIWMECCDIQSNLIFKTKLNTGLLLLLLLSRVSRVWLCVTP